MKIETIKANTDFSNSVVPENNILLFVGENENNEPVLKYKDSSGAFHTFIVNPQSSSDSSTDPYLLAENIKYNVTIEGITGTFTGDGDATVNDVLSGKKAYVKGSLVTGNIQTVQATLFANVVTVPAGYIATPQTLTVPEAGSITTNNLTVTVPVGYIASARSVTLTDANLRAENIKSGVEIFGVVGTYTGDCGSSSDNSDEPSSDSSDSSAGPLTSYFYLPFTYDSTATINGVQVNQTGWKTEWADIDAPTVTTMGGKNCMPFDEETWLDTTLDASFWGSSCTVTLFVYQVMKEWDQRVGYFAATVDYWFGVDSNGDVYSMWAGNGNGAWDNVESDSSQGRSQTSIIFNAWTHIAYVHDASTNTFTLYINGTAVKTITLEQVDWDPMDTQYLRIGAWGNQYYKLNGGMRQVRVFTSALTAQEVASVYSADSL